MLGFSGAKGPDTPSIYKLFERKDVTGPSDSIPQGQEMPNQEKRRSRKRVRVDDNADEGRNESCAPDTKACLPPLLANDALAQAVSEVTLSIGGWADAHIFKLFAVLVKPPPSLNLNAIEGLGEYLTQLQARLTSLVGNGVRKIATHCFWVLMGKFSTPDISRV